MCVRKIRIDLVVKNSRKSLFKTLLKISPFDMTILTLKQVEINTEIGRKN